MSLSFYSFFHLFLLLGFWQVTTLAQDHKYGHSHQRLHEHSNAKHLDARKTSINGNHSLSSAEELVQQALVAAAARNKARFENPKFNTPELDLETSTPTLADPLLFSGSNDTLALKRDNVDSQNASDINASSAGYSIPPELAEAAKIVAEATPQIPKGDHEQVSRELLDKYGEEGNDTNTPPHYKTPEGLLAQFGSDIVSNASTLDKRAYGWWMIDMPQLGLSPFAPAGYKVCVDTPMTDVKFPNRLTGLQKRQGLWCQG